MADKIHSSVIIVRVVWFLLGAALMAPAGYYVGVNGQARKEAEIVNIQQEKVLEDFKDIYSDRPVSRDDAFKRLYNYAN